MIRFGLGNPNCRHDRLVRLLYCHLGLFLRDVGLLSSSSRNVAWRTLKFRFMSKRKALCAHMRCFHKNVVGFLIDTRGKTNHLRVGVPSFALDTKESALHNIVARLLLSSLHSRRGMKT